MKSSCLAILSPTFMVHSIHDVKLRILIPVKEKCYRGVILSDAYYHKNKTSYGSEIKACGSFSLLFFSFRLKKEYGSCLRNYI